ncbi:MAG: methylmalonyl Co-A mutase-associated GTPase MeaB [candidate division Zixibacteria bacterium]|nr:methylmalonyl Co-A mutase-associated GTPase MeaB [candidate division Zixibacteria bacterium]
MTTLDRFLTGDRVALAKVISFVEDRADGYDRVLSRIFSGGKAAYRVGLTGPPGAGKSSLVNRLAVLLADQGLKVGIIAVDPSSPFSGGALLGDRVRMQALYGRPEIFVRSMATRGSSGGLAAATKDVCVVLEGFGFDIILVETVGVGQIELDVASVCDTVVVVFVPESGDAIQAMKSGLMEIANVFCLNKSDRPGAERIKAELESILDVHRQVRLVAKGSPPPWETPVIPTVAIRDTGIAHLWEAVFQHRQYRSQADPAGFRKARARSDLLLSLTELTHERLERTLLESDQLNLAVEQIVSGQADPYTIAHQLFDSWRRG